MRSRTALAEGRDHLICLHFFLLQRHGWNSNQILGASVFCWKKRTSEQISHMHMLTMGCLLQ